MEFETGRYFVDAVYGTFLIFSCTRVFKPEVYPEFFSLKVYILASRLFLFSIATNFTAPNLYVAFKAMQAAGPEETIIFLMPYILVYLGLVLCFPRKFLVISVIFWFSVANWEFLERQQNQKTDTNVI
ncbi:unnamed protein product [Caenorhabditis auriculariae]|uniref:Uncharacterized protein n=1 Tax=Caenorhabditis auriculariae TaxID=2777116 RepID=A0A8S1I054_9PELO|nr:unnamed protein product [Caenorhabditis auriculariae]